LNQFGARHPRVCLALYPGLSFDAPALGPALLKSFLSAHDYETTTLDLGPLFLKRATPELAALMNPPAEGSRDKRLAAALWLRMMQTADEAVRRILEWKPDIVGFTAYTPTWHINTMLAERIKRLDHRISVVIGGPEVSRLFILKGVPVNGRGNGLDAVDALVPGEGELPLLELVSHWDASGFQQCSGAFVKMRGEFVWTKESPLVEELDSLPFPDFSDCNFDDYGDNRHLVTYFNRGCYKKCVFCEGIKYSGKWRTRSGRRVADEIEHLAARYPAAERIDFSDTMLNGDIRELISLCGLMRARREEGRMRRISWLGQVRVRPEMTKDVCDSMGAAGCTDLWIGVESGSQRVIDAMKKGFSIPVAEANIRNYREAGIRTGIYLMAGFPTETAEDFEETLGFLRRNASAISIISVNMVSIDCQCGLHLKASSYGVDEETFHPNYWESRDGSNTFPERFRRYTALRRCAMDKGIGIGPGPDPQDLMTAYEHWRTSLAVDGAAS
jgi:hypothetical protein